MNLSPPMMRRSARRARWCMPERVQGARMAAEEDAIILCGGAGTRLRSISDGAPKSLMAVSGRPFLELLLSQLQRHGFQRVILATGYRGNEIQCRLGTSFGSMELAYSGERVPLGTGGALRNAAGQVRTANCLVMNGDSYTDADLAHFAAAHVSSQADASLIVVPADERSDAGFIATDAAGHVVEFLEKDGHGAGRYVNAGIYALRSPMLFEIPSGVPVSLERELFPAWIQAGFIIRAFFHRGKCVDIGTPERYQSAQSRLANAELEIRRASEETR